MKNRQIVMVKRIFSSLLMLVLLSLPAVSAPIDMNTEYFAGKVGINKIITSGAPGFKSQLYVNGAAADTISAIIRAPLNQTADLTQWVTSNAAGVQGNVLASIGKDGKANFPAVITNDINSVGGPAPSNTTYLGYNNGKIEWKTISVAASAVSLNIPVNDTVTASNITSSDSLQTALDKMLAGGRIDPLILNQSIAISSDNDIYSTAGNIYTLTGRIGAGVASPVGKLSVVADTSSINGLTLQPANALTASPKNIFAIVDNVNKKVLEFNPFTTAADNYKFDTYTRIPATSSNKILDVRNSTAGSLFSVGANGAVIIRDDDSNTVTISPLTGIPLAKVAGIHSGFATFLGSAPTNATLATLMGSNTTGYATSADKLVFSNNPTFTTSITSPLIIGSSGLILRTASSDMIFQVNGGTEAMRIANSGNVGIGIAPNATDKLAVSGNISTTRLNNVTVTPVSGIAPTLTLAGGSTFVTSGAHSVTLTATGTTSLTFPAVTSGTIATQEYVNGLITTSSSPSLGNGPASTTTITGAAKIEGVTTFDNGLVMKPSTVVLIGGTTGVSSINGSIMRIAPNAAGVVPVTAAQPIVTGGADGQFLILKGKMAPASGVQFSSGAKLRLASPTVTITNGATLTLIYDTDNSGQWIEVTRSLNN